MEFAFCCIDFDRSVKGLVVRHDMLVGREVLRGAGVKDPMFGIAVLAVPTGVGLSRRCGRVEGDSGF